MNQNNQAMQMMNLPVQGLSIQYDISNSAQNAVYNYQSGNTTLWDFWHKEYYPQVIHHSYPIYLQERAMDKGAKAFEILKMLIDKKIVKLDKVSDFVEAMDALIKTL